MKEGFLKNTGKGLMAWKLAILKCFIKCFCSGLGVFVAGLAGLFKFSDLSEVQWFCLFAQAGITIGGVVDGFLSTTFSKTQQDIKDKESDQNPDETTPKA